MGLVWLGGAIGNRPALEGGADPFKRLLIVRRPDAKMMHAEVLRGGSWYWSLSEASGPF